MKICLNCGKKLGIISGDHFGLLCDACYITFGGGLMLDCDGEDNPEKCKENYERIANMIDESANANVDKELIKKEFYKRIDERYQKNTGVSIQEQIEKEYDAKEKEIKRVNALKEREIKRANYANSFNEFYEYDVVTILNENHGQVDKEKMMKILSEHARNGWKLHTMYSNELGKNALVILGLGVNSTACEDVMVFERRIQNFDE